MAPIFDLKVRKSIFVLDPDDFDPKKVTRTVVAKPTEGPHRWTLYVPHDEHARISVGKAHPSMGEDGIALETKSHIHLWTHSLEDPCVGTYLHIGKKPLHTGYQVNAGTDGYAMFTSGASSHVADCEVTLMSQSGSTLLSSMTHNNIISHEGSILMNAKDSVVAKTPGCVDIRAGDSPEEKESKKPTFTKTERMLGMGLVVFEAFEFLAPLGKLTGGKAVEFAEHKGYITDKKKEKIEHAGEKFEAGIDTVITGTNFFTGIVETNASKFKEEFIAEHRKQISNVLKHATALTSLVLSAKKTYKKTKKHESGWFEDGTSWFGWGAAAATAMIAAFKDFFPDDYKATLKYINGQEKEECCQEESASEAAKKQAEADEEKKKDEGKIKLTATEGICINTDKSVSLYAGENVSLAGFMSNSMTGMGCSMKAYNQSSVWGGMGASLKAMVGDVAMTTDFGEANVKGHAGVEVSSADGDVKLTGEKNIQLNSIKEKVMIHGQEGIYMGSGKGPGHGFIGADWHITLGTLKEADKFKSAAIDLDHATLKLSKPAIMMKNGPDNKLIIQKSGITMEAKKLELKMSGPIKINGSTVNIN